MKSANQSQAKTLILPGRLPGLNEYSAAERTHRQGGARFKKEVESKIYYYIKQQLRGVKFTKPVHIKYNWIEKNRYRDKDNIAFAKKFVQDALVTAGVLANDGWKEVDGFSDSFEVDKNNPRIEISIKEV